MSALIARKVARLVDVIDDLRGRVRAAVAAELSKAVATTVRDVLAALLGGRPESAWDPSGGYGPRHPGATDDWDDSGHSPDPFDPDDDADDAYSREPAAAVRATATISTSAISLAVAAGSWLYRQSRSRLCGVAGALAVGVAAAFGGPLTQSVVTVAAAVNQLIGAGESPAPPVK